MDTYRLKIKIGEYEFEAEGDPVVVQEQFAAFKELVNMSALLAPQRPVEASRAWLTPPVGSGTPLPLLTAANELPTRLLKIMKQDGRVVSLTARPQSPSESALLLLFGQKVLRDNDAVTGMELNEGLTVSGLKVLRADRLMDRAMAEGLVIVIGQHRGRRYRLTNSGFQRASEIADSLIATVA